MTYQQFIYEVMTGVKKNVKENITVNLNTVIKNNGKERRGLTVCEKGVNISPTIYLEEYYNEFQNGKTMKQIIDEILELYKEVRFERSWEGSELQQFENIKDHIVCKIVNFEKNEQVLLDMPFYRFLDLAVTCYVILDLQTKGTATMTVKNEHLKMWNISKEEIIKLAKENSERLLKAELKRMKEVIAEMTGMECDPSKDDDFMYVLSNGQKHYGAVCITYEHILDYAADEIKESFYIIPSSVHEVILIPESKAPEKEEIRKMIVEVNETQVDEEDRLSDNVYYYDLKKQIITM